MGRSCGRLGAMRNACKICLEILKGRDDLEDYGHILMNLKETGQDCVDWVRLAHNRVLG
jgi:hypothetical protein